MISYCFLKDALKCQDVFNFRIHTMVTNLLVSCSFSKAAPQTTQLLCPQQKVTFLKGAQAGGRAWDLLILIYFHSLKQRLRQLGYCAPNRKLLDAQAIIEFHSFNDLQTESIIRCLGFPLKL